MSTVICWQTFLQKQNNRFINIECGKVTSSFSPGEVDKTTLSSWVAFMINTNWVMKINYIRQGVVYRYTQDVPVDEKHPELVIWKRVVLH